MGKYAGLAQTALSMITAKGAAATLKRRTEASFDPITQIATTPAETTATARVVGLPPARDAEKLLGSLENRKLLLFYIAMQGLAFAPAIGDELIWGGATYALVWKQTYDPAADGPILTVAYGETR